MDANNLKELYAEVDKRMNDLIEHARRELSGVRTGRCARRSVWRVSATQSGGQLVRSRTDAYRGTAI